MSEPVILGGLMKDYLINSDDDFAVALRNLFKEHGSNVLNFFEEERHA